MDNNTTDKDNGRLRLFAVIAVLIAAVLLLLNKSCSQSRDLDARNEYEKLLVEHYNDTIRSYINKNGELVSEKQALVIENENLKKAAGLSKDETLKEKVKIVFRDTAYSNGSAGTTYVYDTVRISDLMPFDTLDISKTYKEGSYIKYRLTGYGIKGSLKDFSVDSDIRLTQTMDSNGKVLIATDCTDLKFSDINTVYYDDSENAYKHRKRFGPGLNVSVGYDVIRQMPYVGIGIGFNFTPKKWQF